MEDSEYKKRLAAIEEMAERWRARLIGLLPVDPPSTIYHYTDVRGLLGLIKSGTIWATHASRLNDTSEYEHGIGVVAECVRKAMPNTSKPLAEKILTEFRKVDTYVASYSAEADVLSQWRSYSGTGVGYCLGLNTTGIATLDESTPLLEPVIYKESTAFEIISQLLFSVDEYLRTNDIGEVEAGYLLGMVGATLANLACTIKHDKFDEEREFRQFYQPGATSLDLKQCFRIGRFGLTPYVEVPFRERGRLPLESVLIGPCQDAEPEALAVEALLREYCYKAVQVSFSKIPLRY